MQKHPAALRALVTSLPKIACYLPACLFLLTLIALLPGCAEVKEKHTFSRRVEFAPGAGEVQLEMVNADLALQGIPGDEIIIEGWSTDPAIEFIVEETGSDIHLRIEQLNTAALVYLELKIPNGSEVLVTQAKGAARLSHFNGSLSLTSGSAAISADSLSGFVNLATRRGTIQLSTSAGDLYTTAEAADIELIDVHGQVSASNIIGGINFSGGIHAGDKLRFETDHGSVAVNLGPESSATIQLGSAGGRIVCTLPGLSGMFNRCSGVLGEGAGSLTIRTVSGAIILNALP